MIDKPDMKNRIPRKGKGCQVVELRLVLFIFCMEQRSMEVIHEKKIKHMKNDLIF